MNTSETYLEITYNEYMNKSQGNMDYIDGDNNQNSCWYQLCGMP